MKLWLITQDAVSGYDTYDSAVVVAETEQDAREIHPMGGSITENTETLWHTWAQSSDDVTAVCIGTTDLPAGEVVCASYNA